MMFEKIWKTLEAAGFDVYSIGLHEGICQRPYVVIKDDGQRPYAGIQVDYDLVDIILYYPLGRYSEVQPYMKKIIDCMFGLKELKYTSEITPTIIDEDKKAYVTSVKYQIFKRRRTF